MTTTATMRRPCGWVGLGSARVAEGVDMSWTPRVGRLVRVGLVRVGLVRGGYLGSVGSVGFGEAKKKDRSF